MKKLLFLLIVMTFSGSLKCQSKSSPSLPETISWIKQKLETYTYSTMDIKVERSVSFNSSTKVLTIKEDNYNGPSGKASQVIEIPLDKLNPSSVLIDKGTDQWLAFHLILRTNNESKDIKTSVYFYNSGNQRQVYNSNVEIFITKDALLDNLDTRLKEAFSNAIRLCGGTSKEIF
jgi:hypothetical protein